MWLTRLLLERRCPVCDAVAWAEQPVCAPCWADLGPPMPRRLDSLVAVHARLSYGPEVARLILRAKNGPDRALLRFFGLELAAMWNEQIWGSTRPESEMADGLLGERPTAVMWVPAFARNRRQRGLDQGQELARVFAAATEIPLRHGLRRRGGRSRLGMNRAQRLAGPPLQARRALCGTVVVIDDVIATGASLNRAASVLREAGASHIIGMAIASADSSSSGA